MATFCLTRNGVSIASRTLDQDAPGGDLLDVAELQRYGFEVTEADDGLLYRVAIGDEMAAAEGALENDGQRHRKTIFWHDKPWFESARGFVSVRLESREDADESSEWTPRASIVLYARPTKLNEYRYLGMSHSLAGLSNELILDVAGKASRGVSAHGMPAARQGRPAYLELEAVDRLWREIGAALGVISKQPVTETRRRIEIGPCWGAERLLPASLAMMASRGLDPRKPTTERPFATLRERLEESVDTQEHRSIAGLLEILTERLNDCEDAIADHITAIEAERPFRVRGEDTSGTLYEQVDVPRLNRLNAALSRTAMLKRRIGRYRHGGLLKSVKADRAFPATPVFSHVVEYRKVRSAGRRYLSGSLSIVEIGSDVRAKSTSRMYEQWVFLQVATAFARAGLIGDSVWQLRQQVEGARRFVVDLPRDARVSLRSCDGREVRIRYEPHVFGRELAFRRGDSVYRGKGGDAPWSPDVLIEVMKSGDQTSNEVDIAFVVDAKYSSTIRDQQWADTSKYFQIRSTASNRSVVRHVWLAHPSPSIGVRPRDTAINWTDRGPDVPHDEPVDGAIAALPPECRGPEDENTLLIEPFVSPAFEAFARGICGYLGLTD